ncbi:L-lactate permease [Solihabitans fulvus]|uniref:L-lactate permease n=1 Tax=Solihabitans fulvus TaxID=1892852 RepID=A0A5B2WU23_9PSEU|nr:L-lactate permease [Solihabitans fulvus]KAA2254036.1 L-lactate permease [Solihabitans fulvus]
MNALLAALPPLVALMLLLAKRSAVVAASSALLAALVIAAIAFPVSLGTLGGALGRLAPTAVEVVLILLGGLVLNQLMSAAGAQQRLAEAILGLCGSPTRAVVLILLGVTPFAESVTGFGIGVVVAIPLLRQLGLPPVKAAIIGLLGLLTVPWGSLGPGSLVAAQLGGVDYQQLGVRSALLSGPLFLISGVVALSVAYGVRAALAGLGDLLLGAVVLAATLWAVNSFVGVPLAGVLGGLAVILVLLLVSRLAPNRAARRPADRATRSAVLPYLLLVVGLLGSRLVLNLVGNPAGWSAVASPALWLLVTCVAGPVLLGLDTAGARAGWLAGLRRTAPVATATVFFLAVGVVLTASGMSAALAGAAAGLGRPYLLLAPFVGGLGGFLAGSNTGANAMFAASQAAAAHALGVSTLTVLGAQNTSAALSIMASAPRVALAAQVASTAPAQTPAQARVPAPAGGGAVATTEAAEPDATPRRVLPTVVLTDLAMLTVIAVVTAITA